MLRSLKTWQLFASDDCDKFQPAAIDQLAFGD